jgi:pimeloyl-ACP methyl ester carboxylesterase
MRRASADGTTIAFSRAGHGPPLILVDGALCHRGAGPNRALAQRLSRDFTVLTYDRRGRGESGDTAPYAVEREIEDIAALVETVGGPVSLYGISSGGLLALEAATRLADAVARLVVYEIPFVVDESRPPVPHEVAEQLDELLAAGRRGAAVKLFMRDVARLPSWLVGAMPAFPGWRSNKAVAHTLVYDIAIMGDTQRGEPLPAGRWSSAGVPALVLCGGRSPAWVRNAAAQLAEMLPAAQHRTLDGQTHYAKADALAPVLTEFFTGTTSHRVSGVEHSGRARALAEV